MGADAFARKICYIAGMQPIARRLIVVGAVILCGAGAGVALGDFVAGPGGSRLPGMEEAMGLAGGLASDLVTPADPAAADASFAARSGPASYSCEGCDAKLHNEVALDDGAFADVEPLPPYQPEQAALVSPVAPAPAAAPRVQVPAITLPIVGTAAGSASPSSSGAPDVLPPVR
ncbi:MAG: hypothetical protein BGP16_14710 [Sphingobium sp. 66-54]|nr:MAG: hypothetical protein BGP16_14710 [Sphingobium sp. 66-54]